jgi:beta-lactamase superfamily II metal-dependent hydrolase
VNDLLSIAIDRGTEVIELFAGHKIGNEILVLGPSLDYYRNLLCDFRDTPPAKSAIEQAFETVKRAAEEAAELIPDAFHLDLLGNSGETTAENNSSLILLFVIDGKKLLFTGDAGIPALSNAADLSEQLGIPLNDLRLFHVPHHGSKHNLGSDILKRIRGEVGIVSAGPEAKKHPAKKITNALYKNEFNRVLQTKGKTIRHHHNAPDRGWPIAEKIPWFDHVEG